MHTPILLHLLLLLIFFLPDNKMKTAVALVIPTIVSSTPPPPFTMRRLDHIVLRCADTQTMLNFYISVLGAQPTTLANGDSSIGRMSGCLSHLSIGTSLIDLQSYDNAPIGRKLHAGGAGLAEDEALPTLDSENGTLDHFAINVEPYDPEVVRAYLTGKGFPPIAEGERYGADGNGYSIYLRDPERNVVELKCGSPSDDNKEL